ncbi:MAG: hypothetical protein LC642_00520 [Verrucomicrobiaceae bacterium]|nr:hypothetical protein [Verrucomicrobiaceae bacterium]
MLRNGGGKRTKNRRVRFPGIVEHARKLGITRIHLYYLLTGARPWQKAMLAEYRALKRAEATK